MHRGLLGRVRRVASAVVSISLVAQLITMAPPVAVAVAKPAPTEMVSMRGARSKIMDNADGTFTYEAYPEPIHYRAGDGSWQTIDSALVKQSDPARKGWKNKANAFTLSLPESLGSEWVSIETTGGTVACRPAQKADVSAPAARAGAEATGTIEAAGAEATGTIEAARPKRVKYRSAFGPGVDVQYDSTAEGLKETIVLDKYRGKNIFTFDLDTASLTPKLTESGGVALYSTESTVPVYFIKPPFMEDSRSTETDEPSVSTDVHYELTGSGATWSLSVVADTAWLKSKERVWPVSIDPSFIFVAYNENWQYYQNNGYVATMDSYVTDAYPNNNYGTSGELKVGYYPGAGNNRAYVMPDVAHLYYLNAQTPLRILGANMNMYCTWRYNSSPSDIYCGPVAGGWGEGSLNWNNQPGFSDLTVASVSKYERVRFEITNAVQTWMNTGSACGVAFWTYGNDVNHWTKFASREAGGPVFECCFTTPPVAAVTAPSLDAAPRPGAHNLPVSWNFTDAWGKPQSRARVEVRRLGSDAPISTAEVTSEHTASLPAPSGGWTKGRYVVRVQPASLIAGYETWGAWSAWQRFDVEAAGDTIDTPGAEGYRATDSAGGATVDLATGRLLLSRTDFSAPALGGALGLGLTYDSMRTTDVGAGPGWNVGMPSLGPDDQRAPNTSFEQWSDAYHPTGWYSTDPSSQPGWSALARTGAHSLGLWRAAPFGGAQMVADNPVDVTPGQQLDAAGWVRAAGFTSGTGGGALLRIHYYDANDTWLSCTSSQLYVEYQSPVWRRIAVRGVVPPGAYRARLSFDMVNSYGQVCLDDVTFRDGTMGLTDADGTSRTLKALAGGAYQRDPLSGGLALKRTNVAAGIKPVTQTGAVCAGASTDGDYAITGGTGYDAVTWNAGAAWLKYDLPEARVLSEARLYLWDGDLRSYTYALEYSENGSIFYPVTYTDGTPADTVGRSWMTHRFTPVKAKSFRIVALGNTVNEGFHVAELELPVTTLSESPVAFNDADQVTGIADTSGNLIKYTYDAKGRLASSADSQGRHADLNWSGDELASLDWTGVGSGSATPPETGVVSYVTEGDNLLVKRKTDDGTYITAVTYTYTGGRIAGVTDADGVATTIGYDTAGRVGTITAADGSHVTYDYAVPNQVTITAEGGAKRIVRVVTFDPALGYQVTKTVVDPGAEAITTTYAYDAYGHIASVTDALGRVDTYTCDAHGNVTATKLNTGPGQTDPELSPATAATYTNDRLATATDAKGNVSSHSYDARWRPLSSSVMVTNDGSGLATTEAAYDEWGHTKYGELPTSSADDLLENGTFERAVSAGASMNGWQLTPNACSQQTVPADRAAHGLLHLALSPGAFTAVSDAVAVTAGTTYMLSAWFQGRGFVSVVELDPQGNTLGSRKIMDLSEQTTDGWVRFSSAYAPSPGATSAKILLVSSSTATLLVDNVRLECANQAGSDNLLENGSVERPSTGTPECWEPVCATGNVVEAVGAAGARFLSLWGQPGSLGYSWWLSPVVPVAAGADYTFSAKAATNGIVVNPSSLPESGARVEVSFFSDDAGTWPCETGSRLSVTDGTSLAGTVGWKQYTASTTAPPNARSARYRVRISQCSGSLLADGFVVSASGVDREEYTYDEGTHTFLTSTDTLSGAVVGSTYDARGRVTEVTHKDTVSATATRESVRTYDALDRLKQVQTAPASAYAIIAKYTYSDAGRLKTVTDPLNRVTNLTYDRGRVSTVKIPSGITTLMSYDALGRLAAISAPYRSGETTRVAVGYDYDAVGRLNEVKYRNASGGVVATSITTYDKLSRPDVVTWTGERQGSLDYTYDSLGRTTSVAAAGPAGPVTTTATFDKASSPLTITLQALGVTTATTNTFAKTGQWRTTSATGGKTWEFATATDGTLRRIAAVPASPYGAPLATRNLSYDTALRLVQLQLAAGAATTASESLTYDTYGRVASVKMVSTSTALTADQSYTYDAAGRLATWTRGTATATYTTDNAGNLTKIDRPGTTTDLTMTYGLDNEIKTSKLGSYTTTYTNDTYGRRTRSSSTPAGVATYTWDNVGQLAQVTKAGYRYDYAYGPTGMREKVTVTSLASGAVTSTTESVWEGGRLAAERVTDSAGVATYRYVYGPGSLPLELIVTNAQGTASYAYLCDRAGSVIALTDSAGAVVATYAYDPWGAPTSQPASGIGARNPLRYRGYYYDVATALYYLPARYYDPVVARFLSPDPAAPSAGDPLSLNRYAYCVGDPVNADDPSGAVMDIDGDGRIDSEDTISESYVHTPSDSPLKAIRRARMNVAIYAAHGTVQQLIGAEADLYDLTGWPSFGESSSGSQLPTGDGTSFGRNNWNWMPSRPDDTTWMLGGIGAVSDVLTPLFGPAWAIPAATGLVINGGYAVWHYQPLRERGDATWGDVFWTGFGAVPMIGIVPSVVTVIGYDFIHWAEPSN